VARGFEVFLVTPEREVWSGEATLVVARGTEGEIGIMAGHAPTLIQLDIGPLFVQPAQGERVAAAIDGGFLHVTSSGDYTRVDVLAEHAQLRQEIDVERARGDLSDAEARVRAAADDAEAQAEAQADLARATTRLNLAH
jgi:F-type H+-transporting ATPase subunit epsilon